MTVTLRPAPRAAHRRKARPVHLPDPPTDAEKYSYFDVQRRWPFVLMFLSQLSLMYAFAAVMLHTTDTALGLVFLTVMVPPVFVNLWLRVRRRRLNLEDHVVWVEEWRGSRNEYPSVDVLLPSCGEHPEVLRNAYLHISRLDWAGRLRVYVLDDAANDDTRALADEFGFTYVVRPNRGEWKKAGNLIAAFDATDGEFIVVFDADFVPRADFLWETVPYMSQANTGVVQTAQYFDTDNRVNYLARYAGTLQDLFFRWIQPARDTCEAAICAGTNVVYRRSAVVAAGGFAKVPLGEDVHSGVKLWVANYRTRYVPIVVAKGLAPDSWDALTNQQYRWCRSSMLLMMSSFFRDAPFGAKQRVCFWAAFLYYMASAAMPVTSVLPTLIMVWFYPQTIHPGNYIPMIPGLVCTVLVFPIVARGWRPTIHRVTTINSFCHLFAVYDAVRQKVQAWVPTGATGSVPKSKRGGVPQRVALALRVWLVVSQLLLWGGLLRHEYTHGVNPWLMWPAVVLGLSQLYMLVPVAWGLGPKGDDFDEVTAARVAVADR